MDQLSACVLARDSVRLLCVLCTFTQKHPRNSKPRLCLGGDLYMCLWGISILVDVCVRMSCVFVFCVCVCVHVLIWIMRVCVSQYVCGSVCGCVLVSLCGSVCLYVCVCVSCTCVCVCRVFVCVMCVYMCVYVS